MIRRRAVSCQEVVTAALARLDAVNPRINAVVRPLHDPALAEAAAADQALARGTAVGPLHGVPITTKVNVDQAGCPTDNGVVAFKDLVATRDNPVVANLRRAGAIVIGRTNAPAFGKRRCALYATCFVNYNKPAIGMAARAVLNHIGVETRAAYPGCCGMPQLEAGNLPKVAASAHPIS
jgi:Fe-S oxidoreductase